MVHGLATAAMVVLATVTVPVAPVGMAAWAIIALTGAAVLVIARHLRTVAPAWVTLRSVHSARPWSTRSWR